MADPVYKPIVALVRLGFRGLGVTFHLSGTDNIPRTGGAVLAMNHVGYLDFTFAGLAARSSGRLVRFMAKKEVFDHPVSGPFMRGMKHIPVDRRGAAAASYALAVAALRRGEIVGVFPEATISESYDLKEFKTGAVRMAQEAGVPLVPLVLWCSQRIYTKGRKRDLTRGTPIRIVVGEPFSPGPDAVQATVELKARMAALLDEARRTYPGRPRGPEDTWWFPAALGGTAPTVEEAARISAERAAREIAARSGEAGRPPRT